VCKQAAVGVGRSVVVFGAGPVGLLCCAVAKAFGASKVVNVDINDERLRFSVEYAGTTVWRAGKASPEEEAGRLVEECGLGRGADAVVEATGAAACIGMAVHVVRGGGAYCQAGMVSLDFAVARMVHADGCRVKPKLRSPLWPCVPRRLR